MKLNVIYNEDCLFGVNEEYIRIIMDERLLKSVQQTLFNS